MVMAWPEERATALPWVDDLAMAAQGQPTRQSLTDSFTPLAVPANRDWARMRGRPAVKAAIFDRMTETDWAPFRNLAPDPWPKVEAILLAA